MCADKAPTLPPYEPDERYEKLNTWIGDSEETHWSAYTTELVAITVLCDFTPVQWSRLEATVLTKPEYWQQRCAVSLGEDRSAAALDILKLMLLKSVYTDVRIMCIYELDWAEIPIERLYVSSIKDVINSLPVERVEPELKSLLAKAESAAQ
ncbi:HEAT repeat domain-containing protein [Pseudomonas purpurea]|uniref:HEAT repeat domain-containing protein n=1 Tax=Pseudomonas purpurea TaxID=3136737 RepID=UPI00326506F7